MNDLELGKLLKTLRGDKSLRQVEASTDVSKSHISRIEKGERHPSPEVLKRLSKCYFISYHDLLKAANYLPEEENKSSCETLSDISVLRRAQENMTPEQLKQLREIAQTLFKDAFKKEEP